MSAKNTGSKQPASGYDAQLSSSRAMYRIKEELELTIEALEKRIKKLEKKLQG